MANMIVVIILINIKVIFHDFSLFLGAKYFHYTFTF